MKLAGRLVKAYLRLIRRSRAARRASIGMSLLALLALGPRWALALACFCAAVAVVVAIAVRDGVFAPLLDRGTDDDWF